MCYMYELNNSADKLKKLRIYKGFGNQVRAAELLGMTRAHYNAYETGKKEPGIHILAKICNTFKIDINYFLCEGKPDDYDLAPEGRKRIYGIPFVETSVSKELFSIFTDALQGRGRFLINVKPLSGVTITINEFKAHNPYCVVLDCMAKLVKLVKKNTRLYIIDHCHYPDQEVLKKFLDELIRTNAGIILISKQLFKFNFFDNIFYLFALSLDDIEQIVLKSLDFLNEIEELDYLMKQKILITITSEVYYNLGKLKNLLKVFSNDLLQNFSLYNLFHHLCQ